ncbi:MAG: HDOD domain-containing protein [Candidatus Thiodiazotropha sp.]|jgi:HD-like signal output (HDOD) protein
MPPIQYANQQVLTLQHLPPLSATATRLLGLMGDETISLEALAQIINQDPGLAARLVGLANSAYFGQKIPVLSVEDAIIRVLGLNMVKSLAFSIAVSGVFETKACHGFDLRSYWSHSLSTAMFARQLSAAVELEEPLDPDAIYLAGLLLEIGVLVMVHEFPQEYAKVLLASEKQSELDILYLENEIIGINHYQAGALLADHWHLPQLIIQVIAQNADITMKTALLREVILVGMVSQWVKVGLLDEDASQRFSQGLKDCCGLMFESIDIIKTRFLQKREEISVIAAMLAN